MIFSTSKIIKRFKVSPKQLLIWSNRHKLNIWVSSLMWIPPLQESIWLKDDKRKKRKKEARDRTNAYLASASCPMLCRWNLSPLVWFLQSGKCPQNESVSWEFHFYTASQTFLLEKKQVQKIDREVVQQRRRQAQVLLIILQCSFLYMQLSVGWVCVLRQKLLITVNCSFKCAYNGQIAHDYKIPYHGCGRIWARGQLCEIMAFGESWLTSVHPKGPLFRKFAADNAITVECETWVEPSLAWAISYNRWNLGWTFFGMSHFLQQMKCLFTASFIFTRLFIYFY